MEVLDQAAALDSILAALVVIAAVSAADCLLGSSSALFLADTCACVSASHPLCSTPLSLPYFISW